MKRWLRSALSLVLIAPVVAIPSQATAAPDIVARLSAIPGMTVVAEHGAPAGYRLFALSYRQPSDHRQPSGAAFSQRLTLLHRDTTAPMVLETSGYSLYYDRPYRSEPTFLLNSNQISVEQRFFTPSRPQPATWSNLTIWQAATDHHRLVTALKPIYDRRWISTGGSKGGMASVYHRRFYPSDVDGTVAYVAPNDVVDDVDEYARFLDTVGNDPACRTALQTVQREALTRRAEMVSRYAAWAQANNRTFRTLGSADRAFELLVLELPFLFWQYGGQHHCRSVPPATATTDQLYRYLDLKASFGGYTDQAVDFYLPYYVQAGTQLGYPTVSTAHLNGLLRYPGLFAARSYVPPDIPMSFDTAAMPDVDAWVRSSGSQLLFVYGQIDPWSAEPFRLGSGTRDSFWYQVPGGNHNVDIRDLPAADAAAAKAAVLRWAGATGAANTKRVPGLDDQPPAARRLTRG